MTRKFIQIRKHTLRLVTKRILNISNKKLLAGRKALIEGGFFIKSEALKYTPIDLGNLRGSAFVLWDTGEDAPNTFVGPDMSRMYRDAVAELTAQRARIPNPKMSRRILVIIGFTVFYAVYVHEADNHHNPPTQKEYLLRAFLENRITILTKVARAMKHA